MSQIGPGDVIIDLMSQLETPEFQYIMKKKKNMMTRKQLLMEETQQWGNKPKHCQQTASQKETLQWQH
jgi:hypothetical protein